MRHLANRMEKDLIESLIIIELPCAFLAPWLLFHGLNIFISQIVKSAHSKSVSSLLDIDMQSVRGNFNVSELSNWL